MRTITIKYQSDGEILINGALPSGRYANLEDDELKDFKDSLNKLLAKFDEKEDEPLKEAYAEIQSKDEKIEEQKQVIVKKDEEIKTLTEKYEELAGTFRDWDKIKVGDHLEAGTFVTDNGVIFKVITTHNKQQDWRPSKTPSLFIEAKSTKDLGDVVAQDFKQPSGMHDAYKKGDKVKWRNKIFESLIDNNVYSPTDYPQGWKQI